MSGASDQTLRVTYVNANYAWRAGAPGAFHLMVVTSDGARHALEVPTTDVPSLLALCASPATLLWDPVNDTLIAAGVRGDWLGAPGDDGRPRGDALAG